MKRKILTFKNSLGQKEDLIPYVDGYGVVIGGTNLVDYLAQLEDTFEKSKLFLGAFESETALLNKYPDGGNYEVGTYAIVSDSDAIYIYDTDSLRWLKTASNISGIMQLNGLTPVNGSLTITGGDIKSIVSEGLVDNPNQTITAHLSNLYDKTINLDDNIQSMAGNVVANLGIGKATETVNSLVFEFSNVPNAYKNSNVLVFSLGVVTDNLSYVKDNSHVILKINYIDGSTKEKELKIASYDYLTYGILKETIDLSSGGNALVYETNQGSILMSVTGRTWYTQPFIRTYDVWTSLWVDNEEGTGYKYTINLPTSKSQVLNISKKNNNIYTTAVIDYKIANNVLTLYSDVQFTGNVSVSYRMSNV